MQTDLLRAAHYGASIARQSIAGAHRLPSATAPDLSVELGGYLRSTPTPDELRVCQVAYAGEIALYLGRLAGYAGAPVEVER
jgi:hypothetical protein